MHETIFGGVSVKQGTFLYDNAVVCDVRIVRTDTCYGTGDHEDPPELANDQPGPCFYVEYSSAGERSKYRNSGGGHRTLKDAVAEAERRLGRIDWEN